jgi:ATP-dependent exoDNAse (exonuclease V) beta subunit
VSAPLADQRQRDRIRDALDVTLVVEAAAGTGKTSELVRRMVAVLTAGVARLDQIVGVTFTEAAAGELKLRLRGEIERVRQGDDTPAVARARLRDALPQLEEARIGTIHSFCADLLRERPVEAEVDPCFEVAPEDAAGDLLGRVFDRWFEHELADPTEGVRRLLRRRGRDEGPRGWLRAAAAELVERRDFPAPWRHGDFARDPEIDALLGEMASVGAFAKAGEPNDYFTQSLVAIAGFVADVQRREVVQGQRDYDGLEAALAGFVRERHWTYTGFKRVESAFDKPAVLAQRDGLYARLQNFVAAAGADLAPRLRDALWPLVDAYEDAKERSGQLDFLDLLLRARALVRDNPAVRRELQTRFTRLFVDEFQDTDPLQAELLLLLAADDPNETDWRRVRPVPGKLFLVGDPKQSIYRFRRADVALYEATKRQLAASGAEILHLTTSFRAVPDIQTAVNAAFAPLMQGDSPSQATYVPLAPFRSAAEGQPPIVVLPVPAPYGDYRTIVKWRIEDSLPDATAAFVDWLVRRSGWTVTERSDASVRVPLAARHVCLLFRRLRSFGEDVTRPYVRALEARHLPHVLVGGGSFHRREEVESIRNALAAIERPRDEQSVFATLRGPLIALGDGPLLAWREHCKSLDPLRPPPADLPPALACVADALALLRDLHFRRNRRPIAETIGCLLAAARAHAGLAIWPTGEQALANVTRLMDLARRAERRGVVSFRAFVDRLADDAEHGEASEAPVVEEGTEGVRMMTVHRAKGLEFPVVILADMTARATPTEPSRHTDPVRRLCVMRLAGCAPPELLEHGPAELVREQEEAVRVLYVAATRARDLLVVPAVGDARHEGWLSALDPALHPPAPRAPTPESSQPVGCPAFGPDSVPGRPPNVRRPAESVVPGLHRPEAGTHAVVWWDPAVLELGVEESVGLRQQKLLQADEAGVRAEDGIRAHAAWQAERARVRADGGTPSERVVTATEHATAGAGESAAVEVEQVGGGGPRPHGKRFGVLVHAVLAAVDLDADRLGVEALTAVQARMVGAPPDEAGAAVDAVVRALAHPLVRRAARAAQCRREVPVTVRLDDGTLVEGVADAAFFETAPAPAWTVVDWKTDVEIAGRLEEYRRQVGLYAAAIARATGVAARGVLLRV